MLNKIAILAALLILTSYCSRHKGSEIISKPEPEFYGGWINLDNNQSLVFLPASQIESSNFMGDSFEAWSISDHTLNLFENVMDEKITIEFEILAITNIDLKLKSAEGNILSFRRRKYGELSDQLINSFESNSRKLDRICAQTQEMIKEIPAADQDKSQVLGLWKLDSVPLKLAVTEPSGSQFIGFSEYYFKGGMLRYLRGPNERLQFENGVLILYQIDNETIVENASEILTKQESVLKDVEKYMNNYGYVLKNGIFTLPKNKNPDRITS